MEAEVRGRQSPVGLRQFHVRADSEGTGLPLDPAADAAPCRHQLVPDEGVRLAVDLRQGADAPQHLQPALDTLEVAGQGEVRLRGRRERLGGRLVAVAVHLHQERQRLADHRLIDLIGDQLPALDELVQAEAVLGVPGQRLGQHAQPTLPGKGAERVFGAEPVPPVLGVLEVGLQQHRAPVPLDAEHPVVRPAGQRAEREAPLEAGRPE